MWSGGQMMNHGGHMLLMVLAFALLFVLPLMGVSKGLSMGIAIVAMIGSHLLMMPGHSKNKYENNHKEHNGGCH